MQPERPTRVEEIPNATELALACGLGQQRSPAEVGVSSGNVDTVKVAARFALAECVDRLALHFCQPKRLQPDDITPDFPTSTKET